MVTRQSPLGHTASDSVWSSPSLRVPWRSIREQSWMSRLECPGYEQPWPGVPDAAGVPSGRVGHEHNEIRNEIESEFTSLLHQLPMKEMVPDKDAARNHKQEVDRDSSSPPSLVGSLAQIWNGLISYDKGVLKLQKDLKEKATCIDDLTKSLRAKGEELQNLEVKLKSARQENLENLDILGAGRKEVQRLKSNIEETVKASKDAEFHADQLKAKCKKLESQLALIEQKTAQESLTSGSYSDDHANPSMLEVACKAVDKAIDDLARVLYNTSKSNLGIPRDAGKFEHLIRQISPAQPADFSRAIQVRYVWSHWICYQVFRDFGNVFFDFDQRNRTSPLASEKHALECFQSFQQKKSASSLALLNGRSNFRSFCSKKYQFVFPVELANCGILPSRIIVNEYGRFVEEGEIFDRFVDVAKTVWLLHDLAFSFDPPASILRMARGEPYDKQFHDSVVHVEDGDGPSAKVALMIRPAFRVRKSIVRSRVLTTGSCSMCGQYVVYIVI